jgi:hypothetical protein
MKIKWVNIFGLAFLIFIITLMFKLPGMLDEISYRIDFPHYLHDPIYGLMFLGLICVTIVAVAKVLSNK